MVLGDHSSDNQAKHNILPIDDAYKDCKRECNTEDHQLSRRRKAITQNINTINEKIKQLRENVTNVDEKIYTLLKKALSDLNNEFNKKLNILKSDLVELQRQLKEIEFSQAFVKDQSDKDKPVNFLKTWSSFKKYKKKLVEQKSIIKDIEVNLALEGNIKIVSDSNERKIDIDNLNSEKLSVVDATRKTINNQFAKKSTDFRTKLVERAVKAKDFKQFHPSARANYAHSSMVPSTPADMPSSYSNPSRNAREEQKFAKEDDKSKVKSKIENLLESYNKNIEQHSKLDSIATEAVRRSLFGVFAENYSEFKEKVNASTLRNLFKSAFKGSEILTDINRIILYFNLPFCTESEPKMTKKIFTLSKDDSIRNMLEKFEKKEITSKQPNVILIRVEKDLIVGGYASHGWCISEKKRGDST